jgi:hypothetical protein
MYMDVIGRPATSVEISVLFGKAMAMGRYRFALEFLVANRGLTPGAPIYFGRGSFSLPPF